MKTLKDIAISLGYEEKEREFVDRGLMTEEERKRSHQNRELSERFGVEITN